ncbi:MAG: trypsin-like peptidase domain-containing protein [Candidatus Acidiferrum sp.]
MKHLRNALLGVLAAVVVLCHPFTPGLAGTRPIPAGESEDLSFALCPIVYPVDQSASDRGFQYLFYGNGFFINQQGYLLTVAHVLSQLSDAQPYIVLRLPMAPPRLLKAEVIAIDRDHDVALLRATPNPFAGRYQVRFLPLAVEWPAPAQGVLAAALRPSRLKDPHTYDAFSEDHPSGQVLEYQFSQLDRGRGDTELLLFNHDVLLGDSGAPVVSAESQAVVGLVEGRWLRAQAASVAAATAQPNSGVGAAVPIHYAIPLLQQHGVAWHSAGEGANKVGPENAALAKSTAPVPLSLIAAPHPPEALEGGEVVLDAAVNGDGQLEDIKVVQGQQAFVDKVLSAAHTWSFMPAAHQGNETTRIGIVFQFASPSMMPGKSPERRYDIPATESEERSALPAVTIEPQLNVRALSAPNIILAAHVNARGELMSIDVLDDEESLASSVIPAIRQWQFVPGKCGSADCVSAVFIVVMPRHSALPIHGRSNESSRERK